MTRANKIIIIKLIGDCHRTWEVHNVKLPWLAWCGALLLAWLGFDMWCTQQDWCWQPNWWALLKAHTGFRCTFSPGSMFVTQHCSALVYPGLEVHIGKCSVCHSKVIWGCTGLLRQFSLPECARAVFAHLRVKFYDTFVSSEPHSQNHTHIQYKLHNIHTRSVCSDTCQHAGLCRHRVGDLQSNDV